MAARDRQDLSPGSHVVQLRITAADDVIIVSARGAARELAREIGFGVVDQTRIATAVSEIVRNIVQYAGAGTVTIEVREEPDRTGLVVVAEDEGPGIPDVERVLEGGYSTGRGFGRGIAGTRSLMDEFELTSEVGRGTRVRMCKWLT